MLGGIVGPVRGAIPYLSMWTSLAVRTGTVEQAVENAPKSVSAKNYNRTLFQVELHTIGTMPQQVLCSSNTF